MLSKELLNKQIVSQHCGYRNGYTLEQMIECFNTQDGSEFYHNGITYYPMRKTAPAGRYLPAICTDDWKWTFFETWDDLVEQFKFPDGKTMLDIIFDYDD